MKAVREVSRATREQRCWPQHRYRLCYKHSQGWERAGQLPADLWKAQLHPCDQPRRDERPAPRAIPEFVMGQLKAARTSTGSPTRGFGCWWRFSSALGCALVTPPGGRWTAWSATPQGAVYLRYRNHKMRRDAVVPIDDELAPWSQRSRRVLGNGSQLPACCRRAAAPTPTGAYPSPPQRSTSGSGSGSKHVVSLMNSVSRCMSPATSSGIRRPLGVSTMRCRKRWSDGYSTTPATP